MAVDGVGLTGADAVIDVDVLSLSVVQVAHSLADSRRTYVKSTAQEEEASDEAEALGRSPLAAAIGARHPSPEEAGVAAALVDPVVCSAEGGEEGEAEEEVERIDGLEVEGRGHGDERDEETEDRDDEGVDGATAWSGAVLALAVDEVGHDTEDDLELLVKCIL